MGAPPRAYRLCFQGMRGRRGSTATSPPVYLGNKLASLRRLSRDRQEQQTISVTLAPFYTVECRKIPPRFIVKLEAYIYLSMSGRTHISIPSHANLSSFHLPQPSQPPHTAMYTARGIQLVAVVCNRALTYPRFVVACGAAKGRPGHELPPKTLPACAVRIYFPPRPPKPPRGFDRSITAYNI